MINKQHRKQKRILKRELRKNVSARYCIEKSPLWGMRSPHMMAKLLGLSVDDLYATSESPSYNKFDIDSGEGKAPRHIQEPTGNTLKLHYKFTRLLDRIQRPAFLHSATKKRSHVTNADAHKGVSPKACTDIQKFFENTTSTHIKSFFYKDLGWSHDLARLMANALTVDGHLPTGSAVSPLLSYFAHRGLFSEIEQICSSSEVVLTLYVDDITISGKGATKTLLYKIKRLLRNAGLNTHKDRYAPPGRLMVITGAVPTISGLRLRNKQRKSIIQLMESLRSGDLSVASKISGKIASAKTVDEAAAAVLEKAYVSIVAGAKSKS